MNTIRFVPRWAGALAFTLTAVLGACGGSSNNNASDTSSSDATVTTVAGLSTTATTRRLPNSNTVVDLNEDNDGKTVEASVGDVITIHLSECTSCGYHWEAGAAPDAAVVKPTGDESQPAEGGAGGTVGGSGKHLFHFDVVAKGTTTITENYIPPGKTAPDKVYKVTIKVT